MDYVKSPMDYTGNKFSVIGQIESLFPKDAHRMVDLFCGGCDVVINTDIPVRYANDINYHMINVFQEMQRHDLRELLQYIDSVIQEYQLSKTNVDGYNRLREHYNKHHEPLDLFILSRYAFNHQIRFNSAHEFNSSFGWYKSSFNDRTRANLTRMLPRLQGIEFSAKDFRDFNCSMLSTGDFVYADPPYLIACGTYNDGKRGFTGWTQDEEIVLYIILDMLSLRRIRFAMSNVIEHKGRHNELLEAWQKSRGYMLHNIKSSYRNSSYHGKNTDKPTVEVLITNY